MKNAYYITIEELLKSTELRIPGELQSGEHLIYSSPATLSYNSPGAQGFGVKRAGLLRTKYHDSGGRRRIQPSDVFSPDG